MRIPHENRTCQNLWSLATIQQIGQPVICDGYLKQIIGVKVSTDFFDALEWLAAMCSHVPNKGEQMVRYYGYYSNVKRGRRKNKNQDEWMPCILEANESSKEY